MSAAVLMAATLAGPAFAEDNHMSSSSSSTATIDTSVASSADLACMSAAVDAREGAVLTARADLNAKIIAALTTRRASLKAAYTISSNADRKVAIKAALTVFAKSISDARAKYKADTKAAWTVFMTASKACNINADVRVKSESKDDHDNGRHLGQLKKQLKNGFSVNSNGKVDIDLGL